MSKLVVFAEFFGLLQKVKGAVDVFFFEVVDGENIADFAELFAGSRELARRCSKVDLLYLEQLLKNSDCLNVFALSKVNTSFKFSSMRSSQDLLRVGIILHFVQACGARPLAVGLPELLP